MQKNLFLLEWKLWQSRAWAGWMLLWAGVSFIQLSGLLMTSYLLGHSILPPVWLLIWVSPLLGYLIKVRAIELNNTLVQSFYLAGTKAFSRKIPLPPGSWSVDRVNGRYRLNRIMLDGKTLHYPYRPLQLPLFLTPEFINFRGDGRDE
jgi:hypothetical protein